MSKAENLAAKLIIPKQVDDIEELCKFYYIKGYQQAEKDLKLTWEDLATIEKLGNDFVKQNHIPMSDKEYYQEVLKRFKDLKNENQEL